jgi:hypothetical protein
MARYRSVGGLGGALADHDHPRNGAGRPRRGAATRPTHGTARTWSTVQFSA